MHFPLFCMKTSPDREQQIDTDILWIEQTLAGNPEYVGRAVAVYKGQILSVGSDVVGAFYQAKDHPDAPADDRDIVVQYVQRKYD